MTDENKSKDKPAGSSHEDRVKEIKKEEQEDASSYYASGDSKEPDTTEADFNKPVPSVDEEKEEMSLLKAVSYLGFGMGAIAIVFILFFLRDIDERVISVDTAVTKMDEKFVPFKDDVEKRLSAVTGSVDILKGKVDTYERMIAVMELKRALVSIQEVTKGSSPEVKAKAGEVIASIETLLTELGEGPAAAGGMVPEDVAPAEEPSSAAEPLAEVAPEVVSEEEATPVGKIELEAGEETAEEGAAEEVAAEESSEEGGDDGQSDEEEEEDE